VELYELDPRTDSRWPRFLDRHPHASVFHSTEWLEALRLTYGYEPVVYTTSPAETELENGQAFCRIDSWLTGRRLVSVPFSDHAALLMTRAGVECLSQSLKQMTGNTNCKYVEIRPLDSELAPSAFCESSTFYRHFLRLDGDIDSVFRGFHKSCVQRTIQRAIREKLEYIEGRSDTLIHQFRYLLLKTRRRHHLPPQPVSWFKNLARCMGDRLKIRIASKNGRPVAGIITLSFKQSLVYKYGCSDADYHQLGGMAFLFWRAIQEAKLCGLSEFDMGRSEVDNPGLVRFKERWGAQRSTLKYWRYPAARFSSCTQSKLKIARRIFSFAPDIALNAVGQILYRHVG
jgi:hypothetical protein